MSQTTNQPETPQSKNTVPTSAPTSCSAVQCVLELWLEEQESEDEYCLVTKSIQMPCAPYPGLYVAIPVLEDDKEDVKVSHVTYCCRTNRYVMRGEGLARGTACPLLEQVALWITQGFSVEFGGSEDEGVNWQIEEPGRMSKEDAIQILANFDKQRKSKG